ncbi:MAG TPA: hypothetical protein VL242_35005 [Sorangium sp.]|nr:hypothetical protein [Sorangium sp.]
MVSDKCGVFVSASASSGGIGTKKRPFKSFAEVAANRSKRRVYACAEAYDERSGIVFTGDVEVYGGFTECDGEWSWSEERATLTVTAAEEQAGTPNTIALMLDGGDNRLQNLNVIANGATAQGSSSIALLVNGGKVELFSSDLTAGKAGNGDPGTSPSDEQAPSGISGIQGEAACAGGTRHDGPEGAVTQCPVGGNSTGGRGGAGGTASEDDNEMVVLGPSGKGGAGTPPYDTSGGSGGNGQPSPTGACEAGKQGALGEEADPIVRPTGRGTIDATGFTGVNGANGTPGKPGQGGGGGGGAMGGTGSCSTGTNPVPLPGASGGSGGSGGCGGEAGGGGQAGGSSIALVILDAEVSFNNVTLTAGDAGNGGQGGNGQRGGSGGPGGAIGGNKGSADSSCEGGRGGNGSDGRPGDGGHGGHSLGVAFKGSSALEGPLPSFALGKAGGGGQGGTLPSDGEGGEDGLSEECWNFDTGMACLQPGQ